MLTVYFHRKREKEKNDDEIKNEEILSFPMMH